MADVTGPAVVAAFADPARLWTEGHDVLHVRGPAIGAGTGTGVRAALLTDGARLRVVSGVEAAAASGFASGSGSGSASEEGPLLAVSAETAATAVLRLDVPLGDAAGYWHPGAGWDRHLVADWASRWRAVGLVDSAPLGCLYDTAGRVLLAFAADRAAATTRIRFGLAEDTARFGVWLALDLAAGETCRIQLRPQGAPFESAVRELARALVGGDALPVPEAARVPAYSTWYSMHRGVHAAGVEAEARLAAAAGCGVLLLDDGWQRHAEGPGYSGSGDWTPDPEKFPDFAAHVATVQAMGLRYMAWIAPLFIGERTTAHAELAHLAPHHVPRLGCRVLDPRLPEARRHAVDSCVDLVRRHGLDGLKIDFLDFAMAYADAEAEADAEEERAVAAGPGRDDGTGAGSGASTQAGTGAATAAGAEAAVTADVGLGLRLLLAELRARLRQLRGDELLVELRQPYTGPGMQEFGNLLRASDCPADATANRVRTLDTGLLAASGAVHSDMLMWDPAATPETAAGHLHSALFATPQISVDLAGQSTDQRAAIAFWLDFWRTRRDVLTRGEISAGRPDLLHQTVTARSGDRAVVAFYAEHRTAPVRLAGLTELALVNSTTASQVVLDVEGPGVGVRLDAFDACGRPAGSRPRTLGPGPCPIAVPPSGLCVVRPVSPEELPC